MRDVMPVHRRVKAVVAVVGVLLASAGCQGAAPAPGNEASPRFEVVGLHREHGNSTRTVTKGPAWIRSDVRFEEWWNTARIVMSGSDVDRKTAWVVYCHVERVMGGTEGVGRPYPYDTYVVVENGSGEFLQFAGTRTPEQTAAWQADSLRVRITGFTPLRPNPAPQP